MLKKTPIVKNFSLRTIYLLALLVSYIFVSGCNQKIKPECKHQLLTPSEANSYIYTEKNTSPYFLKTDTSKHLNSHRLYNQISSLIKEQNIDPDKCAIQWGQSQNNEIIVFAGLNNNSAINKFFCSLLNNKTKFFGEIENIDSHKIVFLFSELNWKKDKDGFEWPNISGETKGLKEL
jgi:hypothetical protein